MTSKEAIKLLSDTRAIGPDLYKEAIDLAIAALKIEDLRMDAAIQKAVKKSNDYDWDKINKDLANAITAGDGEEKTCENCRYYTVYTQVSYKCQCCSRFLKDNWAPIWHPTKE